MYFRAQCSVRGSAGISRHVPPREISRFMLLPNLIRRSLAHLGLSLEAKVLRVRRMPYLEEHKEKGRSEKY
jgi:hypothetical protein